MSGRQWHAHNISFLTSFQLGTIFLHPSAASSRLHPSVTVQYDYNNYYCDGVLRHAAICKCKFCWRPIGRVGGWGVNMAPSESARGGRSCRRRAVGLGRRRRAGPHDARTLRVRVRGRVRARRPVVPGARGQGGGSAGHRSGHQTGQAGEEVPHPPGPLCTRPTLYTPARPAIHPPAMHPPTLYTPARPAIHPPGTLHDLLHRLTHARTSHNILYHI